MKVLIGATDDRIVGFTMIGAEAGEVMAAIQTAMLADLPYTKLRDAVIAHLSPGKSSTPSRPELVAPRKSPVQFITAAARYFTLVVDPIRDLPTGFARGTDRWCRTLR